MRKNTAYFKEIFGINGYGKKLLSTFLIFIGAYLMFASSLIIFHVFVAKIADISKPFNLFLLLGIGLMLTVLGVGRFEKKKDWLLYLSIPFMSLVLGFLFTLAPATWHGKLFGVYQLFFFPLVLLVFYYLKRQLASSESKVNFA